MFSNSKNNNTSISNQCDRIDTLIGEATNIIGDINTTGVVRIDGRCTGDINTEEDVIIGETAFVKGNITANNVSIGGYVEGNMKCRDTLEIMSTGKLFGDAEVGYITSGKGAVFNGKCNMQHKEGLISGNKLLD